MLSASLGFEGHLYRGGQCRRRDWDLGATFIIYRPAWNNPPAAIFSSSPYFERRMFHCRKAAFVSFFLEFHQ